MPCPGSWWRSVRHIWRCRGTFIGYWAAKSTGQCCKATASWSLVWDCYAWAVWQFFQIPRKDGSYHDIPGDWQNYSGDFPLWRMSYLILPYFRNKFEYAMEWSFQNLFLAPIEHDIAWLPYQQFCNLVGNLTDLVVKEQNWQFLEQFCPLRNRRSGHFFVCLL